MELSKMDSIIQHEFPTVMVPKYGELEPCLMLKTRLLMAENGLYLETRQPWGHLVRNVWISPRPLPYGKVEEADTFLDVLKEESVMRIMQENVVPEAGKYAEMDREWAAAITWNEREGYRFVPLAFESTRHRVDYIATSYGKDTYLAVDMHSHGRLGPFFSTVDDYDDNGGVKICIVLGDYTRERGSFDGVMIRYSVEGFRFLNPH